MRRNTSPGDRKGGTLRINANRTIRAQTLKNPPEAGQIRFLGYDIFLLGRAYQNHLAYFSQYPLFPDSFPLAHFLLYSALLQRLEPDQARKKARRLLETFGLTDWTACPLGQLPVSLRRRVLLINTLWSEAPVYLLSQPFSYAAPEDEGWLRSRLREVQESKIVLLSQTEPSALSGLSWQDHPLFPPEPAD